jgi:hypothetical protein
MNPLVIYFAPHFPDFPDPFLTTDFDTNFKQHSSWRATFLVHELTWTSVNQAGSAQD